MRDNSLKLLFESQSSVNPEITYKIYEDSSGLNYVIYFFSKGERIHHEHTSYSNSEHGLEVAKQMAESTIKEYII